MMKLLTLVLVFWTASMNSLAGNLVLESERSREVRDRVSSRLDQELNAIELQLGDPIFVRIFKETLELEVWLQSGEQFRLFKTYPICYYSGKLGPKLKEGDLQSPEGFYFVGPGQMNPNSSYHLSFNLGFPNFYDRTHERTGSYLMVHGDCVSIGCFAMTDGGIEEIFVLAEAAFNRGQPFFRIHIFPFRMTRENMERHETSEWLEFWQNLKQGFDYFEETKVPPNVEVEEKVYVIEDDLQFSAATSSN